MKRNRLYTLLCCLALGIQGLQAQTVSALKINEIMVANVDQFLDPSWNFGGWIEVYNPTIKAFDLQSMWISDDPDDLQKIRVSQPTPIPSHGFANLWFDHHYIKAVSQMNMKLDCDGGVICLSDKNGKLIDKVEYPPAIARSSWARQKDGASTWGWTSNPTPQTTNATSTFATERLEAPVVSHDSQVFPTTIQVHVDIPEGATLRFTMDGSTPTLTNGRTSTDGNFTVAMTHVYRFALFQDGYLSSPVVTRSYIRRDKVFSLPILSVVTDPDNLYSNKTGIFVQGTNGRAGKGTNVACNWNMDWDRPLNVEYFSADGQCLLNQEAEMSRCGGHSKGFTPMSFKIHAAKQFEGQNYLAYQFFADKPYLRHKALQIRGGANDYNCRILDASLQSVVRLSGIDMDLQDYQPICHYINGKYMGTINMREPNNKHNVFANHGLDDDEIDMFEIECDSCYRQMCGTDAAWKNLVKMSAQATDPVIYQQIKQKMLDIDEFCNYMAVQFYLGNTDWPQNNTKAWRPIAEDGRFRFILYDVDFAFSSDDFFGGFEGRQWYSFCQLFDVPGVFNYTREVELVPLFRNLIKNKDFCRHFIDAFCIVAGSVFEPERAVALVRQMTNAVYAMQIKESGYPGRNVSPWGTSDNTINKLQGRPDKLYDALRRHSPFGLTSTKAQKITLSSNVKQGRLLIGDQVVPTGQFKGQLFPPTTLRAEAPSGYAFKGWKLLSGNLSSGGNVLFDMGSEWTYYDKGSLSGLTWKLRSFAESGWKKGNAPLGYSNYFSVNTTLDYGGDASNKYPTYYFRKTFSIDEKISSGDSFTLNYVLDDGCVIYVNGREVGRVNMAEGSVNYNTWASQSASTEPVTGTIDIPASNFIQGNNIIAVEVHNINTTSSDICWEASLTRTSSDPSAKEYVSTAQQIQLSASNGALELQACFERIEGETGKAGVRGVVINEVSASNSVFVNEYFKKNDWVELYNQTDEDIDLEGMYLSDDLWDATKWRISAEGGTASTVIPANGYKIIWCDKLESTTQLHAPFKLGNEDGALVVLTAEDYSWQDTLIYCAHDGRESVGRFPDGGKQCYVMSRPTIEKQNAMNSYTTKWTVPEHLNGVEETLAQHSGSLGINCQGGMLCLKSEDEADVVLSIYTLGGAMVMQRPMTLENGQERVNILMLAPGTYIARLRDKDGGECATKFVKK